MINTYYVAQVIVAFILFIGGCSSSSFMGGSKSKSSAPATPDPADTCAAVATQSACVTNSSCRWAGTPEACVSYETVDGQCSGLPTESACTADTNCQWGGTGTPETCTGKVGGLSDQTYVDGKVPPGALKDGSISDECRVRNPLPASSTGLELEYNWEASGENAAFSQVVTTPIVGRLKVTDAAPTILAVGFKDCDGSVTQPAYLFAIDGKDGTQKWVFTAMQVRAWMPPAIGDLNNDGTMRIAVVGMDNLVHVLNADGKEQFTSKETVFEEGHDVWPTGLSVADLALDGHTEIIAGNKVFDGTDGSLKFKVAGNGFSVVGETNGEPGIEIVTSTGTFSGKDGSKICAFATPIEDPAIGVMRATDKHAMIIGLSGDTMPAVGGASRAVLVYDGKDCSAVSSIANSQSGGGPINIADFDGDKVLDFGEAGYDGYMAYHIDAAMWTAKAQDHTSSVTGSTTFDFNGDGKNEVVYADETTLHVFDGTTGKEVYTAEHSTFTARETPVIADVTGSGKARIVVAANTCYIPGAKFKGIRVFKDKEDGWVQTRPIWNQQGYNPLLVTPTGGLTGIDPVKIVQPWLSAPYLAGFRNNIPKPYIKVDCE